MEIRDNGLSVKALQQLVGGLDEGNNRLKNLEETVSTSGAVTEVRVREELKTVERTPLSTTGGQQNYHVPEGFSSRLSQLDHLGGQESVTPSSGCRELWRPPTLWGESGVQMYRWTQDTVDIGAAWELD